MIKWSNVSQKKKSMIKCDELESLISVHRLFDSDFGFDWDCLAYRIFTNPEDSSNIYKKEKNGKNFCWSPTTVIKILNFNLLPWIRRETSNTSVILQYSSSCVFFLSLSLVNFWEYQLISHCSYKVSKFYSLIPRIFFYETIQKLAKFGAIRTWHYSYLMSYSQTINAQMVLISNWCSSFWRTNILLCRANNFNFRLGVVGMTFLPKLVDNKMMMMLHLIEILGW